MPTERQLIDELIAALRALPGARVHGREEPRQDAAGARQWPCDLRLELGLGGRAVTMLIEVRRSIYPRDVRQKLWQIRAASHAWSTAPGQQQTVPLLLAESISPGAKELLESERVGYYDSGGSLHVPAEGIFVHVDRPPPKSVSKTNRSLFSGRRAQALHALLMHRDEWFGVKGLAEMAQVSPATASQVLTELERYEWADTRGRGPRKTRSLVQPAALLDAWVRQRALMRNPPMERFFVPGARAEELVQKLARVCGAHGADYALTHEAAAQRYAPFLSSISRVRCRLLTAPAATLALDELGARPVDEGANLVVIPAPSPGDLLFRQRPGGIWLASPVQVYLDLVHSEGRARELADHLRRERIGF